MFLALALKTDTGGGGVPSVCSLLLPLYYYPSLKSGTISKGGFLALIQQRSFPFSLELLCLALPIACALASSSASSLPLPVTSSNCPNVRFCFFAFSWQPISWGGGDAAKRRLHLAGTAGGRAGAKELTAAGGRRGV